MDKLLGELREAGVVGVSHLIKYYYVLHLSLNMYTVEKILISEQKIIKSIPKEVRCIYT